MKAREFFRTVLVQQNYAGKPYYDAACFISVPKAWDGDDDTDLPYNPCQ